MSQLLPEAYPMQMSQQLYATAPEPKQLFLIPEAEPVSIYQPGDESYLKPIQGFVDSLSQSDAEP
ncbi:hypothetical protein IQ241_18600 [Romeria aff. gracilis LEGE 07310]|uniref:Uncharacterized protein n=1 Tax=Vasconcelosia minhoensis LEGE 07310 TaxID=915328 RepID=A0A8J7DMS6_9CYAN|nr:hypothetical protein [Romeria gracilis]MBE9079281.1 hypothetical protein [Romeria aff. gracilis LEGE 07310]